MKFSFWVAHPGTPPFEHRIEASSREAALTGATREGLEIVSEIKPSHSVNFSIARRNKFDILLFTQEIHTLLNAGLSLVEGIRALAGKADPESKRVLDDVLQALQAGQSLGDALATRSEFPDLYISLVRASEHTSDLPTALERYLAYATQMAEVRQKLISAAVYPSLLVTTGISAIIFLLTYVVPRFSGIYDGMHGDLPFTAQLLLEWGKLVKGHGLEMALVLVVTVILVALAAATPQVRVWLSCRLIHLPMLGDQMRLFHLARLYRTLGMLLEGGIPLARALLMAQALLPGFMRQAGERVLTSVREGENPSTAFSKAGLATAISEQMLSVGERSGELGSMMTRVAQFYEADTARKIDRVMRAFEPILMAFIGIGIGVIVILMYLPIFELAGAIQ